MHGTLSAAGRGTLEGIRSAHLTIDEGRQCRRTRVYQTARPSDCSQAHSTYAYHVDDSWRNFTAAAVTGGVAQSLWRGSIRLKKTIM